MSSLLINFFEDFMFLGGLRFDVQLTITFGLEEEFIEGRIRLPSKVELLLVLVGRGVMPSNDNSTSTLARFFC
jgi:hypothetical protein